MCVKHSNYNSDCFECIKSETYESYFDKLSYMYPDHAEGKPGDFLEGVLVALKPVNIYSRPDGQLIKTVKTGQTVGKIFGYVVRDGVVWWQLYGTPNTFVKHGVGIFDTKKLEQSITEYKAAEQKKVDDAIKKRLASDDNPFNVLDDILPDFETIKWVLISVAIIIVLLLIYKIVK